MSISLSIQFITVSAITLQIEYKHYLLGTRNTWKERYDYIVVGAGSAGAVVANRLTENPNINLLLLEAGRTQSILTDIPSNAFQNLNSEFDWNYTTVRQNNFGFATNGLVAEDRGKVIGGSSTINILGYNRGNIRGYDDWVHTYGAKGWSYAEVLPYFIKSENNSDLRIVAQNPGFHGTKGPIGISSDPNPQPILRYIQKIFNELGVQTMDLNGAKQLGVAMPQQTIDSRTGLRSSTGNAYIDPNPHPNNLHILTNAFVIKIMFSKSNEKLKAIGVQFIKNNNLYEVRANKEIIISAGAINSPQLLMLSGIGSKNHLKELNIELLADLPVGHHLQDHPLCLFDVPLKPNAPINPIPDLNVQQLYELYVNHSGPLVYRETQVFFYYNTQSNADKEWPNTLMLSYLSQITNQSIASNTNMTYEWMQYFRPYIGLNTLRLGAALFRPRSYGSIRLVSNNPYDYPLIDPKFLSDRQDLEDLVETMKYVFYFLLNSSISQYVYVIPEPIPGCHLCPNRRIYECDSYIRCFVTTIGITFSHSVGTCRMGSIDRSDVVVDERLLVKNVCGLRVCDASVMPRIPNANTNAATIMIGEKCSQMIKSNL